MMANEKRLIDANRLLRDPYFREDRYPCSHLIRMAVEEQRTVSAVEVVRCKDCVNYCGFEHCKNGICDVDSVSKRAVYPDDFCSYGERRTNES